MGDSMCAHCGTAHDEENCPSCGCKDKKQRAVDRARAADGVHAVLKMLRPSVANCKDARVQDAFNTALSTLRRSKARDTRPSYGRFADSARARDSRVGRDPRPQRAQAHDAAVAERDKKVQAYYDQAVKGGK